MNTEDYVKDLLEKRKVLKDTMDRNYPRLWWLLDMTLAVRAILEIKENTLPFMVVILGPPSSGKTTVLELMEALPNTYSIDVFTPRSLQSHYASKRKDDLEKDDLLPKIKDKNFLTPELAPLFSVRDEDAVLIMGLLTRLLDGKGLKTISGVHGERSSGPVFFVWIGAAVEVSKNIWKLIARLGPKMFFLRMNPESSYEEEQKEILDNMNIEDAPKIEEVKEKMLEYWDAFTSAPFYENGKATWDKSKESSELMVKIIERAQLLARLRGHVPTEDTHGRGGSNYTFLEPIIEVPKRATKYLYNLTRGYALCQGRNYIIEEDLAVIKPIVLSSAAKERVELLKLLIKNKGEVTVKQMEEARGVSSATAQKTMKLLAVLGLVDLVKVLGITKSVSAVRLKEHFRWILENFR